MKLENSQLLSNVPYVLLGIVNAQRALVIIENIPTNQLEIQETREKLENDVYTFMNVQLKNEARVTLICPATDTHVTKYTPQVKHQIAETPHAYNSIVKPWMLGIPLARTDWVRNILEGRAEQDKILVKDGHATNGFVLLPDSKWDGKDIDNLYLQVIVNDQNIRSIRDLRAAHVPMLTNIRKCVLKRTEELYGVPASKLRLYIHYQPSYYHFHIHVTHLKRPDFAFKSHDLDTVLDNLLHIDSDYYTKCTMHYILGESHGLFEYMRPHIVQL